jgi:hypothetical protein
VAADARGKQVPEYTIWIIFTEVKGGREIKSVDVAVVGDFQEVRVQVLVKIGTKILQELGKTLGKVFRLL